MSSESDIANVASIKDRLYSVLSNIRSSSSSVGRAFESVRLVVVTKGHSIEAVAAAIEAGARILGENYPGDGIDKKLALGSPSGIEWHMIGHIQSRKAKMVCEHYDYVHSIDRMKILNRLNRAAELMEKRVPILLECNVSREESKFGFAAWDEAHWYEVSEYVDICQDMEYLALQGLMTIPPYSVDEERARPYFVKLRKLRDFLAKRHQNANLEELSMGMSVDYQVAIQEGATIVRVGTAIMGDRPSSDG